jgi:uncharacterized ParB-like nuclease family protein
MAEIKTRARRGRKPTATQEVQRDQMVLVNDIILDGAVQPRESISTTLIAEYAEAMEEGAEFPPVVLFRDEQDHLVAADGWHRIKAAQKIGRAEIRADVHAGGVRDAILYSVSANATHGMRRTDADKRKAVMRLLTDPQWRKWSASVIAQRVSVSQPFVSGLRRQLEEAQGGGSGEVQTADGRLMATDNLGGQGGRRRQPPIATTNGHAESETRRAGSADAGAVLEAEPLGMEDPVGQFARSLTEVLLRLQEFDPTEVIRSLGPVQLQELSRGWNGVIDAVDAYSTTIDAVLTERGLGSDTDEADEDDEDEARSAEDDEDEEDEGDETVTRPHGAVREADPDEDEADDEVDEDDEDEDEDEDEPVN